MSKNTNVPDFVSSLGGGVTEQILGKVLTDGALAVLTLDGKKNCQNHT